MKYKSLFAGTKEGKLAAGSPDKFQVRDQPGQPIGDVSEPHSLTDHKGPALQAFSVFRA